jgi:hypothetical protein
MLQPFKLLKKQKERELTPFPVFDGGTMSAKLGESFVCNHLEILCISARG